MNGQTNSQNPFAAWQNMIADWSKAFAGAPGGGASANPFDAWRNAVSSWTGAAEAPKPAAAASNAWQQWPQKWAEMMANPAAATNPFAAWQEAMKPWTQAQPAAVGTSTDAFSLWLSTYQKWAEQSARILNTAKPMGEWGLFNPFEGFNPFQSVTPEQVWQQLFQHYAQSWSDFMTKNAGAAPTADVFRQAERNWLGQLDSIGKELAATMSTEEFSRNLGATLEQSLAAQERLKRASEEEVNGFLSVFQLPSRGQIERLFQRVIAIEERLDDAEDDNRELLKQLKALVAKLEASASGGAKDAGA